MPISFGVATLRRDCGERLTESSKNALGRTESAVARMTTLIDGLLAFARAGAPAKAATAELDAVAKSIDTTIAPLVAAERAHFSEEIEPGLKVRADAGVVSSIVQNLVRNAVLYLGESTERSVKLRVKPDSSGKLIVIEVADTGPGIPLDVQKRLFKAFERGTTTVPGHGLGLATIKRLADAHGGRVELESSVGVGSTFRVFLPRA